MSVSAAETEALICAFRLAPCEALGPEALELEPSVAAPLWLHFNLLDNRARRHLERRSSLDDDGRALLLSADPRIQAQLFPGGFAAILGDLHHDFNVDPEGFGTLSVYVAPSLIITCRRHRVRSIDRLRSGFRDSDGAESPLGLFLLLVERLVDGFVEVAAALAERVEHAEDRILAGHASEQSSELGHIRRVLVRLRRHVVANRGVVQPLSLRIAALCNEDQRQQLHQVVERLDAAAQDMDLITERARLLQEEIALRLGEATNRNLYVLSIVTTALLPITLITGVFGMNVGGLPFAQSSHGFSWVMLGMTLTVVTTLLLLRRRRVR